MKEHAWKACVGETLPWVRIPLSPPTFCPLNSTTYNTLMSSRCTAVPPPRSSAANRDGNSEYSPIFYREFSYFCRNSGCHQLGGLSCRTKRLMNWRTTPDGRGDVSLPTGRLISTTRGCLRDRSASQDRQRRRAVTNESSRRLNSRPTPSGTGAQNQFACPSS